MSNQDTQNFLPRDPMPGSTVDDHGEQHVSASLEGLTSPQIMTTSAAAASDTMRNDQSLGGSLPQSTHGSPAGSISSQILATSATSGVTMHRNLPQSANDSSSSSSVSDAVGEAGRMALLQERAMHERKILHLEQQLAKTRHMFDHLSGSFGVSPSASMTQIGSSVPIFPFMTNRTHPNGNGTSVIHDDGPIQLSHSGMMNGTEYHSSVSACTQPVMTLNPHPHSAPMFSPGQRVFNSQESATI